MTKDVLKEIGIVLLLLMAIVLILGIMLYDYIPNSVTVPAKVQAYELPSEAQEELNETLNTDSQNIVKTYFVDSSTLSTYEYKDNYDKGKVDPFSSYKTETTTSSNTTSTSTSQNSSSSNSSSSSNNSSNNNSNTNTSTQNANSQSTSTQNTNSESTGTFFNTGGKD